MRIGIDITFLFDQYAYRGIGNFGKETIRELVKFKDHEWIFFGYGTLNSNLAELKIRMPVNARFISLGNKRKSNILNLLFFKFKFLPKIKKAKLDLFLSCNFEQGLPIGITRVAVAIHDAIPLLTNTYSQKGIIFNYIKGLFYKFNIKKAKNASIVFTSSEFSKKELVNKVGFEESKVVRTYLGIKSHFKKENINTEQRDIRRILTTYNIIPPYIINYGGIEENKNVPFVIQAFCEIAHRFPDLKLVIVGKEFKLGWDNKVKPLTKPALNLIKLCKTLKIHHRVIFTGEVPENHLPIILSNAKLMLHLSVYEGFGLSAIESLAAGVPLIASNKSCYPEILGDAARLVDPYDAKLIGKEIETLLSNKTEYNIYVDKGIRQASQYTWENTAKCMIDSLLNDIDTKCTKQIVYIIPYFYPFLGGAENNALALAKGMCHKGAKVTVLTSYRKDFTCKKNEIYENISIRRFSRWNQAYYLGFYPGLLWGLLRTKADIIHVHGFGFFWQDICIFIKKIISPQTKFINSPHGPFMTLSKYSIKQNILKKIYTPFLKFFLNYIYAQFIDDNGDQYKWMFSLYGIRKEKVIYIPNGIDPSLFAFKRSSEDLGISYGINRKFIITFTGRFEEYKGVQHILDALIILKDKIKTIKFIAMGVPGGYLNNLIEFAKANGLDNYVRFLLTPNEDIKNDMLFLSDIFILPSAWEGFGISILEAMAHGNAIITTDTEGGRFLVNNEENGYLVGYSDSEAIARNIEMLYKNKPLLKRIKTTNILKAKEFTWDRIIEEYYKKLII